MKNKSDYIAISIESRKGGVGKTSVAMNLARLLLTSKKYEVLFLDLDISGTEASKYVESLEMQFIWKDLLHVVKNPLTENDNSELNLVDLFETYMTGEEIPDLFWDGENENKQKGLLLKHGQINIFSSFLNRSKTDPKGRGHIYGPSALFDEMHSEWFISMIKDIVFHCAKGVSHGKKLAIVIDNAPGYSGLEPVIEEWLTDLGPIQGKFLFVCSIDTPDLLACFKSISEINNLFSLKWETSQKFFKMAVQQKEDTINDEQRPFFDRLAATHKYCGEITQNPLNCIVCGLCFYRMASNERKKIKEKPTTCLALLANKVPMIAYSGKYKIKIDDLLKYIEISCESQLTLDHLGDLLSKKEITHFPDIVRVLIFLNENKIPYRRKLSFQYSVDRLISVEKKSIRYADEKHFRLESIFNNISDSFLPNVSPVNLLKGRNINQKIQAIELFDKIVTETVETISTINKSVAQEFWSTDFLFKTSFQSLSIELNFKRNPIQHSSRQIIHPTSLKINYPRIVERAKTLISDFDLEQPVIRDILRDVMKQIPGSEDLLKFVSVDDLKEFGFDLAIDISIAREMNKKFNNGFNEKIEDKILIISILIDLMIEERAPISDKWLFQEKFWINRLRKKPQQFQNITAEVSKRYFAYEMLNEDPFENSTDIFLEICKIRLRYIDMKLDFNFFTDCAKILSMGDETTSTRIGAIKDLAKKVVRHKNMRHSEGEYVLNEFRQPFPSKDDDEIIQDAEELSEYNKVLSSILGNAQWDLL